ncbi:MAG TPA: nucleotide exchange factor GrpE [Pseudomonadales bacterium]|jgi:molecular chaperone GrpE|nr:nucleotide exchange factor GrpE [Pseudomonadales bacterium]
MSDHDPTPVDDAVHGEAMAESHPASTAEQLVELQQKLAEAEAKVSAAEERALRLQAEQQNLLRRSQQEIEKAHKFALEKFALELLPVVDNLERGLRAIDPQREDLQLFAEGMTLTLKSLLDALARFNIEPIDPAGQSFDPQLHQAVAMVELPGAAPGSVIDVVQKGYSLNGRLLRAAMVAVAKGVSGSVDQRV